MVKKVAIVYDADKTILSEDHPNLILHARGVDIWNFWREVGALKHLHKAKFQDTNIDGFYSSYMAAKSKDPNHGLYGLTTGEMEFIARSGMSSLYYPGIPGFFNEIRMDNSDVEITHNIVSLGIDHMLRVSLGEYVDRIFAYTFMDDPTGGLMLAGTNSSLEKDSATKKISRGSFYGTSRRGFEFPMNNMIVIGDGWTDEEMFKKVANKGTAICVHDGTEKAKDNAYEIADKIGNILVAGADYRRGSELCSIVNRAIRS
jgi:hypothetical protein